MPRSEEENRIARAIEYLRLARGLLGGSPRTLARVRLAISSAKGAARHAHGRTITPRPRRINMRPLRKALQGVKDQFTQAGA